MGRPKLALTFDVDARREYLLGFSKRKRERRLEALRRLEQQAREEKRQAREGFRQSLRAERGLARAEETDDAEGRLRELSGAPAATSVTTFQDDFTQNMFGSSTVTVVTSTDVPKEEEVQQQGQQQEETKPVFIPKFTKFKVSNAEKQAVRLRDKLKGKKTKSNHRHRVPGAAAGKNKKIHHRR